MACAAESLFDRVSLTREAAFHRPALTAPTDSQPQAKASMTTSPAS